MGENTGLKKGAWTSEEDELMSAYIKAHGRCTWSKLPIYAGLNRCGKSCRLRWMNYLRPDLKRGAFTREEEELILTLYEKLGTSWSKIAASLQGRSDNEIKNYWHTHLKEKSRKRVKPKIAKSVPKPSKPDNIPIVILESSSVCSVAPQKSDDFPLVVGNEVAVMEDPGPDELSSEADAFVWPELVELEAMLKAYDEIVISSKPDYEYEHMDNITSVLDFPVSPQKSDDISPPSIDDFVMENEGTDETAMSSAPSLEPDNRNYWNDLFKIAPGVAIVENQATSQMEILPEQNLDFDPNFWNELSFIYQS